MGKINCITENLFKITVVLKIALNPIFIIIFAPRRYIIIGRVKIAKLTSTADVIFLHFEETHSIISEQPITAIILRIPINRMYCKTDISNGKSMKSVMLRIEPIRPP